MAKENKKEGNKRENDKKQVKANKKEDKSLKDKLNRSKEYLDKGNDDKKSDNSISFNFSMKMDKDGLRGDGSFLPPKNMSEGDKKNMAKLIQKSIQDANMFMTRAQNEMMREHRDEQREDRRFEHPLDIFDMLNDRMFEDRNYNERNSRRRHNIKRFGFGV